MVLDPQVRKIVANSTIGQEKRGELRGLIVHKFKIHATQYLLNLIEEEPHRFLNEFKMITRPSPRRENVALHS